MNSPRPLEKVVRTALQDALDDLGAYQYCALNIGYGALTVDVLACVPIVITPEMLGWRVGVFAGIECKRPPGPRGGQGYGVTPRQQQVLDSIRAAGGAALVRNRVSRAPHELIDEIIGSLKID